MKSSKKSIFFDILVTILCLVGCTLSLYAFYNVINQTIENLNENPIGTITFKYKTAQRKLIDRILWDRIKQTSPVYDGDIIRTAELSEATITFLDGNTMELYGQTLAQIFLDIEKGVAIDFTEGDIVVDSSASTSGITLTSGSATVSVDSGSSLNAVATTETESPLSLQMISGNAKLNSTNDEKSVALTEGSAILLDEEGETIAQPQIIVRSPTPNAKYLKQSEQNVDIPFSWNTENIHDSKYIILETSKTRDFTELVEQISFTSMHDVTVSFDVGTWYYRLYVDTPETAITGKLQVLDAPQTHAIVPQENTKFAYRTKNPHVRFMWTEDEYASSWQFLIADNKDMQNPIISQYTTQASSIISSLHEGTWYWIATPFYAKNMIPQVIEKQTPNSFVIEKKGELTPPELIIPKQNAFLDTLQSEKGYHFSWKHDTEAETYTVKISKDKDLSHSTFEKTITNNYFIVTPEELTITEGQWFWTVEKTDSEGNTSTLEKPRPFYAVEGEVIQRTVFPPNKYTVATNLLSDFPFTWKTNLPFDMKFQISKTKDFTQIAQEQILTATTSTSGVSVPIGTWYWRIIADTNDSTIIYATEPKEILVADYLDIVPFVYPAANDKVVVRPNKEIEFTWQKVTDAQYYQFSIFNTKDVKTPVYENLTVEGTSISIDMETFEEGTYLWTMQAMASETPFSSRRTGIKSNNYFSMRKLSLISLVSPDTNTILEGIDAVINPPIVEWSTVESKGTTKFVLSKDSHGLRNEDIENTIHYNKNYAQLEIINANTRIQLPSLTSGTWYWTVIGETTDNYNITPLEPSKIIVNPIPPLPQVENILPANNTIFGVEHFIEYDYIDFSWDSVTESESYIIKVSAPNVKIILNEFVFDATKYRYTDISDLDNGMYTLTVEAVKFLPNTKSKDYNTLYNAIIQRGIITEQTFTIDIPKISAPNKNVTGELYGL